MTPPAACRLPPKIRIARNTDMQRHGKGLFFRISMPSESLGLQPHMFSCHNVPARNVSPAEKSGLRFEEGSLVAGVPAPAAICLNALRVQVRQRRRRDQSRDP